MSESPNISDKATSGVLFDGSTGDWFQTTLGVLTTLFNIFLERIMTDAVEDHEGIVSAGGRTITSLRFADDIDGLTGEEELAKLVERLGKASTAYGIENSAEKMKLMTNNTSGINTEIKVNGQKLETVTGFQYLGSVITDEGSKPEILSGIAQTTAALTRLKPVWNNRSISLSSKIRQDPAGNRTTRIPPNHHKETQTAVVWSCLPFIRSGQNHLARHSERKKKTRQTEEEVGRQHQGMDRSGVRKVPEGNGE